MMRKFYVHLLKFYCVLYYETFKRRKVYMGAIAGHH